MLALYVSLFLNMVSTWLFFVVKEENMDRVFRLSRNLIPPLTAALIVAAIAL
jgi:hypothetical protein